MRHTSEKHFMDSKRNRTPFGKQQHSHWLVCTISVYAIIRPHYDTADGNFKLVNIVKFELFTTVLFIA